MTEVRDRYGAAKAAPLSKLWDARDAGLKASSTLLCGGGALGVELLEGVDLDVSALEGGDAFTGGASLPTAL